MAAHMGTRGKTSVEPIVEVNTAKSIIIYFAQVLINKTILVNKLCPAISSISGKCSYVQVKVPFKIFPHSSIWRFHI